MTVTIKEVQGAAAALGGAIVNTPCLHSRTLSEVSGAEVYLKFENLQFTAAFKERGALNKLLSLTAQQRAAGVIAASAGNHAQGLAYHARRLGIPAVIVMPRFTPNIKVERTRSHAAEVVLHGDNFDAAQAHAQSLAAARGLTPVHPYDDEKVIAGQGTLVLEMLATCPQLETLIVPIGGGGLIAGCAIAAKALKPGIEIIGVQTERYPSMVCAVQGQQAKFGTSTIAEGIAVRTPGTLTLPVVRELVDDLLLVSEGALEQAIVMLLEIEKTVVEGAGAAGLAALLAYPQRFKGKQVGLILCGGNIDLLMLAEIIERGMVRSGRLTRLLVEVSDLPGSLAKVTACMATANANIVDVYHQRRFTHLPLQSTTVEFVVQTRDHAHADEIIAALTAAGFPARLNSGGE
ncbi:MAG: threonine ammonia-lyase [Betaproteobacteria bacterium]|nr:threonine ammonia-lyase [Betaproteobacteria bacterium]